MAGARVEPPSGERSPRRRRRFCLGPHQEKGRSSGNLSPGEAPFGSGDRRLFAPSRRGAIAQMVEAGGSDGDPQPPTVTAFGLPSPACAWRERPRCASPTRTSHVVRKKPARAPRSGPAVVRISQRRTSRTVSARRVSRSASAARSWWWRRRRITRRRRRRRSDRGKQIAVLRDDGAAL